ncbi:MAG: DEAD/DEAH box helicase family protein [Saprospiraceae bacterium]|nr:DEAD/DEAH box helicase family protein [Saprospiraceae bacterium]
MKNSNFTFLYARWPEIYEAATEAEQQVFTKSVTASMYCRQAMELVVNWLHEFDAEYTVPYQNTIAAKLGRLLCVQDLEALDGRELGPSRKVGNNATHSLPITSNEALASLKFLFHLPYIARTYTDDPWPKDFDENHIPKDDPVKVALREIARLEEAQKQQQELIASQLKQLEASTAEQAAHAAMQSELAVIKDKNKHIPVPEAGISEAETRRLYIDADLKAMGWELDDARSTEYELGNLPRHINPTGKAYVDNVHWGDDGPPLAIAEAKKTCRSAAEGKAQAVVYADCVEQLHGRRPIIFYTNGFETWLWDDQFYPPRQVHGFLKAELQLLIDRRSTRKDLRKYTPDPAIAGRYYQKEAIQRIAETFVANDGQLGITGKRRKALVVMATGTGKTRMAVALVDILMKANWAKRVLFLADRNALVTQAKRAFGNLLTNLTAIDLTKEREDTTTRLVFSTYPTIMNCIVPPAIPTGWCTALGISTSSSWTRRTAPSMKNTRTSFTTSTRSSSASPPRQRTKRTTTPTRLLSASKATRPTTTN